LALTVIVNVRLVEVTMPHRSGSPITVRDVLQ
jgi:hypothetical protein